MEKDSVDNVSVIFIAFKNFENKMKDRNYVYKPRTQCKEIKKDRFDFSNIQKRKNSFKIIILNS